MSLSPTQRTMGALRSQGNRCEVVERFNPHVGDHGVRHDLFNIIDILVLDPAQGITGVQACAGSGFKKHIRKLTEEHAQESIDWLTCGGKLMVYGWRKVKLKRGGKAMRWKPRIQEITLKDFETGGEKQ